MLIPILYWRPSLCLRCGKCRNIKNIVNISIKVVIWWISYYFYLGTQLVLGSFIMHSFVVMLWIGLLWVVNRSSQVWPPWPFCSHVASSCTCDTVNTLSVLILSFSYPLTAWGQNLGVWGVIFQIILILVFILCSLTVGIFLSIVSIRNWKRENACQGKWHLRPKKVEW